MEFSLQHVELHVSSLEAARDFYVGKLGLELLDDMPGLNLFAVRAGDVRISVFGGYQPRGADDARRSGCHLIFRVEDLEAAISELVQRGVVFTGEIVEAGGFMRDIAARDPDGNIVEFAQYLRPPLARNV